MSLIQRSDGVRVEAVLSLDLAVTLMFCGTAIIYTVLGCPTSRSRSGPKSIVGGSGENTFFKNVMCVCVHVFNIQYVCVSAHCTLSTLLVSLSPPKKSLKNKII